MFDEDDDALDVLHHTYSTRVGHIISRHWHISVPTGDDFETLAAMLGDPMVWGRQFRVDVTKPRIRDLIDALDGPHGHALMKELEIQYKENQHEQ